MNAPIFVDVLALDDVSIPDSLTPRSHEQHGSSVSLALQRREMFMEMGAETEPP